MPTLSSDDKIRTHRQGVRRHFAQGVPAPSRLLMIGLVLLTLTFVGCDQKAAPKDFKIGDTAPDFAVKDLDGRVIVLSSLQGKPVILRFFETNCRFCKADTPIFTAFYNTHKDKGLEVLYVGSFYENEDALRRFAGELGTVFPVAMDKEAKLANLYHIRVYPQTLFIGPDRQLLAAVLGAVSEPELREILGKYL